MSVNKKVVHILPDRKFVSQIDKFDMPGFENKIVFWGRGGELPPSYHQRTVYLSPEKKNIPQVAIECEDATLIVIYSLQPSILLGLPKKTLIIWRFFGYEIYERRLNYVLSKKTLRLYKKMKERPSFLRRIKNSMLYFCPFLSSFNRSLKRVNYFMGVFYEEYQFLESLGFKLPPFLQTPINLLNAPYENNAKRPIVLLGNSRTFFNNHIDVIELLQNRKKDDLVVKILYSYGGSSLYTETIKREAMKIPNVEMIEKFVSKCEFEKIYREAAAVIINGYRQMALGNIFTAIRTGTKIYLSNKNITYHWLKKNGFKISLVEQDLQQDIATGDVFLSPDDALGNFNRLIGLMKKYTIEDFHHCIREILDRK